MLSRSPASGPLPEIDDEVPLTYMLALYPGSTAAPAGWPPQALITGRVSARTKSSSWAVVQHSKAVQYSS